METQKKKKNNFIVQGGILAIAGIIVRILGLLKRIPLTNIIGDEGNGYYGAAYEIYSIILIISSYSLPLAVSKLVSARVGKGQYRNANKIFKGSLLFALVSGGLAAIIVFLFSTEIATMMLEPMSALSLKVLAPTLFIVAIMGVFRGYFQGLGTMMPTAVSQIVEQVLVVIASLIGAYVLFQYGGKVGELLQGDAYPYAYGAAGASLGPGLGAALGLGFLLFVFCAFRSKFNRQIKKDITKKEESYGTIFKILILTIVPVILSTAIYNISNVLDQRLFNQVMIGKGFEEIKASIWGVYVGKYRVLVNIPIALASAMCASSVPAITALMSRGDKKQVREKISSVIRVTMIISIPCAIGMSVLARPIIDLLFNGEIDLAVNMMYVGTASIVFYSMSTLSNGILQGINRMKIPVTNAAISLVVHLIALFVMLQYFDMGIYAVVYANILFSLQMCIMNSLAIRKHMKYKQEFQQTFIIPLLSAGIMGVIVFLVNKLLEMLIGKSTVGQLIQVAVGGILGVFIYFILLIVLRGVTEKDLASIPFGNKIIKVAKALHILP